MQFLDGAIAPLKRRLATRPVWRLILAINMGVAFLSLSLLHYLSSPPSPPFLMFEEVAKLGRCPQACVLSARIPNFLKGCERLDKYDERKRDYRQSPIKISIFALIKARGRARRFEPANFNAEDKIYSVELFSRRRVRVGASAVIVPPCARWICLLFIKPITARP